MPLDRTQEKGLFAKGLTPEEIELIKARKKALGFKNNSKLVKYLLDKHAPNNQPQDNGSI